MQIQYVTDETGEKIAVQLSLKQWNDMQKCIKKLELLEDLKQASKEMKAHAKAN